MMTQLGVKINFGASTARQRRIKKHQTKIYDRAAPQTKIPEIQLL
ncbi:hypothetical protein [Argonema galeatum]|nr:hypothetical protein [Argonema galeatum]